MRVARKPATKPNSSCAAEFARMPSAIKSILPENLLETYLYTISSAISPGGKPSHLVVQAQPKFLLRDA
jgi:hypothetical protein